MKAKHKPGCLSSYKTENSFLEAAAARHRPSSGALPAACPPHFDCNLRCGYSYQGRSGLHRTAFPAQRLWVNLSHVSATGSLAALLPGCFLGKVGGIMPRQSAIQREEQKRNRADRHPLTRLPGQQERNRLHGFLFVLTSFNRGEHDF